MNPVPVAIALLLLVASFCLALGLVLPIIHIQKLYFFNQTPSLIELVWGLWNDGAWAIAIAVALFSIIFPFAKLTITFLTALAPATVARHSPLARWSSVLSKWSMMDVLLLALVIFAAKSSGLANATAQPGIWFYATSAISGFAAARLIKKI